MSLPESILVVCALPVIVHTFHIVSLLFIDFSKGRHSVSALAAIAIFFVI